MMWDIYRKARQVVVWLGELDESANMACEVLAKFGGLTRDEILSVDLESLGTDATPPESALGEHHTTRGWRAVLELLSRTWFTSSWVVQEVVLAREAVILCGDRLIDWHHVERASHHLGTRASYNTLRSLLGGSSVGIEASYYKTPAKLAAVKRDLQDRVPDALLRSLIRDRDF